MRLRRVAPVQPQVARAAVQAESRHAARAAVASAQAVSQRAVRAAAARAWQVQPQPAAVRTLHEPEVAAAALPGAQALRARAWRLPAQAQVALPRQEEPQARGQARRRLRTQQASPVQVLRVAPRPALPAHRGVPVPVPGVHALHVRDRARRDA